METRNDDFILGSINNLSASSHINWPYIVGDPPPDPYRYWNVPYQPNITITTKTNTATTLERKIEAVKDDETGFYSLVVDSVEKVRVPVSDIDLLLKLAILYSRGDL